ncbi:MAG: hypothetical protein KF905_01610 [Flavobacteriales bacterium]|nr:hypothetical protein [Flavobacteriales bacterium]
MKLVIDVKDNKAELLLEFLKTLSYVKVKAVPAEESDEKAAIIASVKQAVEEMKLVKAGKLKGRDAIEVLNEL